MDDTEPDIDDRVWKRLVESISSDLVKEAFNDIRRDELDKVILLAQAKIREYAYGGNPLQVSAATALSDFINALWRGEHREQ